MNKKSIRRIIMKKLFTIVIAVMIMAFSTVSAFALSYDSPVATTEPETQATTNVPTPDDGNKSPKTGSNDILAYTLIALSVIGCGAASVALVKTAKKN